MPVDTFPCTIAASVTGIVSKVTSGVGELDFTLDREVSYRLTATDCDQLYTAQFTLAGGASTTLDLSGGVTSPFGETVTLARIKTIMVELLPDTPASSIDVGVTLANQIPNFLSARVNNNGFCILSNPDAVGNPVPAGTGDLYKITNNDGTNTATVRVTVLGKTT